MEYGDARPPIACIVQTAGPVEIDRSRAARKPRISQVRWREFPRPPARVFPDRQATAPGWKPKVSICGKLRIFRIHRSQRRTPTTDVRLRHTRECGPTPRNVGRRLELSGRLVSAVELENERAQRVCFEEGDIDLAEADVVTRIEMGRRARFLGTDRDAVDGGTVR